MKRRLIYIFFVLFQLHGVTLHAQEECAFVLERAEKLYEQGIIEEIPDLLSGCIQKGFNKEERLEAYKLVILSYLFDDNQIMAEQTLLEMLRKYPEYEVVPTDPVEFVYLFETYETIPVYSIGVGAGTNFSLLNVTAYYGTHDLSNENITYHWLSPGYNFNIRLNRYLGEHFELNLEAGYIQNTISYTNNSYEFLAIHTRETGSRFYFPLTVSYDFKQLNKVTPYIRIGGSIDFLTESDIKIEIEHLDNSHPGIKSPDIDNTSLREDMNALVVGAVGFKYKFPAGYLFLEANYNHGLIPQVKGGNRYSNDDLVYKYYHVDNDYMLNFLGVKIGYMYSFFKPRKLEVF
jgi:hypothetical protein